jgi:hypothetical protein
VLSGIVNVCHLFLTGFNLIHVGKHPDARIFHTFLFKQTLKYDSSSDSQNAVAMTIFPQGKDSHQILSLLQSLQHCGLRLPHNQPLALKSAPVIDKVEIK